MTGEDHSDAEGRPLGLADRIEAELSRRSFVTDAAALGVGLSIAGAGTAAADDDSDSDDVVVQTSSCDDLTEPSVADEPAPEVQEFLDTFAEEGAPIHTLSTEEAREAYQALFVENVDPAEAGNEVGSVENMEIPGPDDNEIPIRVYTPEEGSAPYPALVYFHGGGWVLGGLDTHDSVARSLTNSTEAVVVSVDYRLAPEHPFPAAVRDARAATEWVFENADSIDVDPDQVAIGGESAGGNLATVTALQLRDSDLPELAHQLLVYPVGTLFEPQYPTDRGLENPYLVPADAAWFGQRYLPFPEAATNAYASPLEFACDLTELPDATVVSTGYGLWRVQSFLYAQRLCDAGVDVTYYNYPALLHDVLNMEVLPDPYPDIPQAGQVFADIGSELQKAYGE